MLNNVKADASTISFNQLGKTPFLNVFSLNAVGLLEFPDVC